MTVYNVRVFGAVGDGIADDTTAIQVAIAAAESTGGVLRLPAGTYRTTAPLTVNPHRIAVRGNGAQCTIITPQLAAGQYALTLGWDAAVDTSDRPGPYEAVRGVAFLGPIGAGTPNCLRLQGSGASPHASGMTLRDLSIKGFDVQVDLVSQVYLTTFERVFFHSAQTYGVRLDDVANAGENIAFTGCCWSGGPGTGVYLNKSGASVCFDRCSFDYLKRALHQRAGSVVATACHFETGTEYGPGGEFILLARNGYVNLPMLTLVNCDFYDAWTNYDTCIRLAGDYGGNGLRVTNPYVVRASPDIPYLIRDDSPGGSSTVVTAAWYGRGDFPWPRLRRHDGTDLILTPSMNHTVS